VVRTDNDISAYSGKPRPGYLALLEDIRAGRIDGVLVWHTDRLHRSPVELEAYITACESGNGRGAVTTQTVKAGLLDLATPTGRMVARTLGNIAHFEVEHMIERQKAAKQQKRDDGRYLGGPRPYGYRRGQDGEDDLVIVEEEAAEIRSAAARVLAGDSLNAIARDMNARGARTPIRGRVGGNKWDGTTVRLMLRRPSNAALVMHDGQIVGTARWQPILDEGTWRGLKAFLNNPARRTTPGPKPRWFLTGALRCGVCGGTAFRILLHTRTRRHLYMCHPRTAENMGGCVGRDAQKLDEWVEWLIFERLSRPNAAKAFKPPVDTAELEGRRAGLQARLDELADNLELDERTLERRARALRVALKEVEDAISHAFHGSVLDGIAELVNPDRAKVEKIWRSLPLERRRVIVQFLMEIVIHPTRGRRRLREPGWKKGDPYLLDTDPEVIEIVWKTP
jgi:DNA invertase Pin-like site-specific DNA recombinase